MTRTSSIGSVPLFVEGADTGDAAADEGPTVTVVGYEDPDAARDRCLALRTAQAVHVALIGFGDPTYFGSGVGLHD